MKLKAFLKGFVFCAVQFAVVIALAATLSNCGGGGGHEQGAPQEGGGEKTAATSPSSGGGSASTPAATAAATATIKGKVTFNGTRPKLPFYPISQDKLCMLTNPNPTPIETYVIDEDGSLENVFVYVVNVPEKEYPVPSDPIVLDQHGCVYVPHIFGIRVGQDLEIRNSDKANHNINVSGRANRGFNLNQNAGAPPMTKKFRRPEGVVGDASKKDRPVMVKCNVHPWMNARIFVMDHPYFAATRKGGTFEFSEKLPPGKYTVVAWHEKMGEIQQEVEVGDGETKEIAFEFKK